MPEVYDGNAAWGDLFQDLRNYAVSEPDTVGVEWVASRDDRLYTVRFVGYEDGPISIEGEDHQKAGVSYVSDVIETEDALLVTVENVPRQLRLRRE